MKKSIVFIIVLCLGIAFLATRGRLATAGIEDPPVCENFASEVDPVGATAGANPGFNYSTGFEASEGFTTTGYISNTNGVFPFGCDGNTACWGHTAAANASLITPTIDTANPATGIQHLRLTHDPATRTNQGYGLGVDARFPHTQFVANPPVRPVAPNTVSLDIAISNPGGMNFRVQPQSNSQSFIATSVLFAYTGGIYIVIGFCEEPEQWPLPTGFQWDTTGGYQNFTVVMDPCEVGYYVDFYYGGDLIYTGCPFGTRLEQLVVFGDNNPGSYMDVDNVVLSSLDECPHVCGNGIHESWAEQCEPGIAECNPGHTCGAAGTPEECTCNRICTLDEPCELSNGTNGPFYGPFDATNQGVFQYQAPAGVDAVSVELCGSTGTDQRIYYWGSCTDPNDPGSSNDDCCDPASPACGATFGAGSDPSASCYNNVRVPNYESCTCHDNPLDGDNCYLLKIRPPTGAGQVFIEVNKKATCGGGHLGACCDTNGADTGCSDNVLSGDCVGADKVWTENGKCVDITCECIPLCSAGPAPCGDDGCGGSCGTCDDGVACTVDSCTAQGACLHAPDHGACSNNNACDGIEWCDLNSGCVPGFALFCDDGMFCNGAESCNPTNGCVPGTPPCTEDESCDEDGDECIPTTIPTVSQWGLVVLTIVLLVAAKVQFGRIRRVS